MSISNMLYEFVKRVIDLIGASVGLGISAPICLVAYVLIKLDSPGPVVFSQERISKGGKTFKLYKFRSMIDDAENILYADPKLLKEYESNSYKIKNDPRLTRIGKFLRKSSIDEIPQLWNVLMGDMSLVGPRAYRPVELANQQEVYPETKKYVSTLLRVKPGVTGPWQVAGRSKINFEQRVRMDAEYASRMSLAYDFLILLKTIPAVLSAEGAG
ncbi:MAG: hypothetical protein A3F33_00740 [Candidatus Woykebacteria bacterium RIFCSPHIGHO2_12_FULL_43_10]|uniref:Bacterial sugar transferase domain-containing protein n=2 Tax=Candidatus Woykeibacteriota TaxID=1817899 RepID=A0A1G1WVR8_9BACT|nr:MAG: hypothetical protein A3J50_00750 [Candidatus Woykebacteria bacterium RIFCSPHIGHO2_02_FULL_43_16b]OGY29000.1 MAG: hypothetical protein A3F33_00740 [Candidatus Woykebacteria bacterium RIFCSPHIGHO2_12_FULL_43_10]OGY31795.1 MAG: hypothetical protein A3A61_02235 [Candidatus Woykebacteria bacterium RIFCSPLOWO2_01_FULL_43_14]